jgi:Phage integrase, N-terminal SAM-like domain
VTHLQKIMLEEPERRNYAATYRMLLHPHSRDLARHFNCSPDRLGPRHIREYQADLLVRRKSSASRFAVGLAALRFFYHKTLPIRKAAPGLLAGERIKDPRSWVSEERLSKKIGLKSA